MSRRIRIYKDDMCDVIRMLVWDESNGKLFVGKPIEFEEVEPDGCVKHGTLELYQHAGGNAGAILQSMMDDLYRMGVRPSDHVPADVAVVKDEVIRAKDEHIADLRESVRANRDRPQVVMPTFKHEIEMPDPCICGRNPVIDLTSTVDEWIIQCTCKASRYVQAFGRHNAIVFWNEGVKRQRAADAIQGMSNG